ncbi:MAG: DoxX family protein [Anaerolineae bacterium]
MRFLGLPFLRFLEPLGPLMARIGVGLVMALHGWVKFQSGSEGWVTGEMLNTLTKGAVPADPRIAWLVLLTEIIAGVLLVLGLLTRISAISLSIVMLVALVTFKGFAFLTPETQVWSGELDWVILFSALALVFIGPGPISLDKLLGIDD